MRKQTIPPVTRQIARELESQILNGELQEGARLYSVRNIAERYGVSIAVGLAAYSALEKKGLVVREAGRGTFVRRIPDSAGRTLRVYSWNGIFSLNPIQALLAELAEKLQVEKYEFHPFYTDQYANYDEYFKWLQIANDSNHKPPDLVAVDDGLLTVMAEQKLLLPLDDFIKGSKEISIRDFPDRLLRRMTYKGKIYSLPIIYSPTVLFYNRDIFLADKIPEPGAEWSWDDLLDATSRMTQIAASGQIARYGLGVVFSLNAFGPFLFQCGGEFFDRNGSCAINTDEAFEGLKFFSNLYHLSGVCSHKFGDPRRALVDLLAHGMLAMLIGDAKDYQLLKETMPEKQWGMVRMPGRENNHTTALTTQGWGIGSASPNPEEAFKFMVQLYKDDNLRRFCNSSKELPACRPEKHNVPPLLTEVVKEGMFALQSSSINAFRGLHSTIVAALSHRICLTREKCLEFQNKINSML